MSIHVALTHRTSYEYDREITVHPQVVRLRPAAHSRTPILAYSLSVQPEEHFLNWQQDAYGNYLARLVFPEKVRKLEFVVDLVAELTTINPFDFFLEESAETFPFVYSPQDFSDLAAYRIQSDFAEGIDEVAEELLSEGEMKTIDFLVKVNQHVEQLISYNVRMEVGVQSCEETLRMRSGSCRDSAYLLSQLFRRMGIASRFVSGYLVQLVEDEKPIEGPSGPTADFTDLHAWTEVYIPGAGWVGLDPTSGLMAGEGHIPLACTPEPSSAAPIEGAVEPCDSTFSFSNTVRRIHEDPRVTKPYSEETWEAINSVGKSVDQRLVSGDVRLTMGGEPTFVSVDDMEGDEWNTTADSIAKRERSIELTKRLRDRFAPGGLILYGEGKWYPGEPIPRWAYGVFWRKDGHAVWNSIEAQGDPSKKGKYGYEEPKTLIEAIAKNLGVAKELAIPALEDGAYYEWKAESLPTYEKVEDAKQDDSLERRTLAELMKRGLDVPTGYVLPLHISKKNGCWIGGKWVLKRGKFHLIPGASTIGLRLPLDSIREATEEDILDVRSPMTPDLPPLPSSFEKPDPSESEDSDWIPRTAIAVETREGRLHVFMPPTEKVEEYLELLAVVEKAAQETGLQVIIEGYEPPFDPRLESLKVTPDPGVIEVNIHPSRNWLELVERTSTLYEEARQARLGAEKFMLDGRHTGTGGGNHVVIGGATPSESPFLRRPNLLASLVAFWQNHPGLSYLFSGLFIGPTSQAPRADEGREDRLFELEIALQTLHQGVEDPQMVDRVMRHLLTDLTGNTHRSEICIDKLYSPDSPTGQLGLVELRGFEMPPHPHMALVQGLLVRSLIAKFWERPYHAKLVRWGTMLHDKFMLPHFVWQDMSEICEELRVDGIPFDLAWLEPFFEFRFPKIGNVYRGGAEIELRTALEPWNVLGEEAANHGMARYVDSSMERLQIKIRGMVEGRHILTCNGRRIPLFPTEVNEEFVGGVRFKAWDPPSALHPNIPAQSPLTFDLVDTWNHKSLGGCIYHVSHPGGRSYETFPVNAREAETRRGSRFWSEGHTSGVVKTEQPVSILTKIEFQPYDGMGEVVEIPPELKSGEFPHTLDLRKSTGL